MSIAAARSVEEGRGRGRGGMVNVCSPAASFMTSVGISICTGPGRLAVITVKALASTSLN